MNSIAFLNQKGGVGKTTSTINIAAELGLRGFKVLIIDADSQGNATSNMGMYNPENPSLAKVLLGENTINEVILHTNFENVDLVPANLELQVAEMNLQQRATRNDIVFKKAMDKLTTNYDFILVDCPPSLSTMTVNVLSYVENILIPIKIDKNSLEGCNNLLNLVSAIKQDSNEKLKVLGTFLTVIEKQTVIGKIIEDDCKNNFGETFINASIRKCVEVQEAPFSNVPISYYKKNSNGTEDYKILTDEILNRLKRGTK